MKRHLLIALLASCPLAANATEEIVPIDCDVFDLESMDFAGHDFAFLTELSSTTFGNGLPERTTTGGMGFQADPSRFANLPVVPGQEIPVVKQDFSDLYPEGVTPPPGANDVYAKTTFTPQVAPGGGFTGFDINHRQNADVGQATGETQLDQFALSKSYATFEVIGPQEPVMASIEIDFDAIFNFADDGFLSGSVGISLIDVTDPLSPWVVAGAGGFFFADNSGVIADFSMANTGEDLTENFSNTAVGTDPDSPHLAEFTYSMDVLLDPNKTYGLGVFSDSSAGVTGEGFSYLDSRNTLVASVSLADGVNARLVTPGAVPEPASVALLAIALAAGAGKRR